MMTPSARESRPRWQSALPAGWSILLAVALLGPALAPGFVLTYDMVWVPDLPVRGSSFGIASGVPRAVPSDAVIAVLDEIVPGMLLQKLVLVLPLVAGGLGIARLARRLPLVGVLTAISCYQWNVYLVERLVLGHWPMLIAYGTLPWLLVLLGRWRETGRLPPGLLPVVALGALSASAGIATTAVLVTHAAVTRSSRRRTLLMAALAIAANAPWALMGLLNATASSVTASGASVFALAGEGSVPAPLAAISLGGVWNGEVVPASREGILGWLTVLLVLAVAPFGWRALRRRFERSEVLQWSVLWVLGLGLALLTWAAPAVVTWSSGHLPGAGVVRDGARLLYLGAPLIALVAGSAVAAAWQWMGSRTEDRWVVVSAVLIPLFLLPDAFWGVRGALTAVQYPASHRALHGIVEQAPPGDALFLPLSSYRQPAWNRGRKVLDPLWRLQARDPVASDDLAVAGQLLGGEAPRVIEAAAALDLSTAPERSAALARMGIGVVVLDHRTPGAVPELTGQVLYRSGDLTVLGIQDVSPRPRSVGRILLALVAWSGFTGLLLIGTGRWIVSRRRP